MQAGERFECLNCFRTDQLDAHGKCQHCGSRAVISELLIQRARDLASPNLPLELSA